MRGCLDEDEILAYRSGALSKEELQPVEQHLETCSACLEVIHRLDAAGSTDPFAESEDRRPHAKPEKIANYLLLDELGSGGMGLVYAAYDVQLDRRIALKLMHHQGRTAAERIRREAQAMARLSHPNVVTVYGVHSLSETDVAISMEYVKGKSLKELMASNPSMEWTTVQSIFVQAANGLAAAHEAGLVHRDFKPDNLLVTDDGQAKIIDFGLVYSEDASPPAESDEDETAEAIWSTPLTRTGARIGTPAYMAPEQFNRQPVDSRTDQFAFCLCLYEAVYGHRPFSASTVRGLKEELDSGNLVLPQRPQGVPRSVETLLRNGLAARPEQRLASMRDVARRLEQAGAKPPWYRGRAALAVSASIAAILLSAGLFQRSTPSCLPEEGAFADLWSPKVRANLRQRWLSSGMPQALDTWRRVASGLTSYVSEWERKHVAACEAAQLDRAQTSHAHMLQLVCLGEQRDQFRTLVQTLSEGDTDVLSRAIDVVAGLTLHRCENPASLLSVPLPESGAVATTVAALRAHLNSLEIVYLSGQYESGLKTSEQRLAEAQAIGYPPVVAEARYWRGRFLSGTQDYERAVRSLGRSYESALALNHLDLAADVSREIANIVGLYQGESQKALQWSLSARGLARLREPGGLRDARSLQVLGMLQALGGDTAAAMESLADAERMLRVHYGPKHPYLARVASDLGVACLSAGKFENALANFQRTLRISLDVYGKGRKRLARTHLNLGITNYYLARERRVVQALGHRRLVGDAPADEQTRHLLVEARRSLDEAFELLKRGTSEEHEGLVKGVLLSAIGSVEVLRGDAAQAQQYFTDSAEVLRSAVGDRHPYISSAYQGLGEVALVSRRADDAIELLQQALEISGSGRDSKARVAMVEFLLAQALALDAQTERARSVAADALKHFRQQGWTKDSEYVRLWLSKQPN